jgi:ribosomal protein L12E/L44/L45/RPP1/RPP2
MLGAPHEENKISKIAFLLMQVSVLPHEKKTGSAIAVAVTGNSNPNHKQEEEEEGRKKERKKEGRKEGRKKEKRRLAQEGFKVKP